MNRRELLTLFASAPVWLRQPVLAGGTPFPVKYRKNSAWEELAPLADASKDVFECEIAAERLVLHLHERLRSKSLPTDAAWMKSLGRIRRVQFWPLPDDLIRYELASETDRGLSYHTGVWRAEHRDGRLDRLRTVEESNISASAPLFSDITASLFGDIASFRDQLSRGIPYWRSRLDVACGIDVFGNQGIAVGDADGDGWDEVYICQPGGLPNRLYRRRPEGKWEDITEIAGVGVLDATASALFLDLRNTGNQDLIVLTSSVPLLFLNEGGARYRHVPNAFRFASAPQGTLSGMAAADYDRDGKLDLYVCAYLYFQSEDQYRYPSPYHDAQNGPPNFLFRNRLEPDGTGYFEDVTVSTGLSVNNNRYSFAAAWCDYDGDGWPDLYVANDFGRNNLYKNESGRFRDAAKEAGVEDLGPGMSAAWFDYDNDGFPDLYVTNMWTAAGQRVSQDPKFGPVRAGVDSGLYHGHTKGNSLYRNRGDGKFDDAGAGEHVEMGRWAWSGDGYDFDLDGTPEIYVTAGMITHDPGKDLMSFFWRQVVNHSPAKLAPSAHYENGWNTINELIREDWSWNGNEPNVFYVRENGRYRDYSGVSGLDAALDSRAFSVTDLDGDGYPDLLLRSRLGPQLLAFRNDSAKTKNRIALELRGTKSNRDAIGARVEVASKYGAVVRWVTAGSGYISQHTKRMYFGFGDSPVAPRLSILWPSGVQQNFENLEAGHLYTITEALGTYEKHPLLQRSPIQGQATTAGVNDLVFEEAWLIEPLPAPEPRKGAGFLCLTDGKLSSIPKGVPFEVVDLREAHPDIAAVWALFRRYVFDYRAPLMLPLLLLQDDRGMVHKLYPHIPDAASLRQDLKRMQSPDRDRLAVPFAGTYYSRPSRNYFRSGAPFLTAGYPDHALSYLSEALRRQPDNFKVRLAVGQIHLEAGRLKEAEEHLSFAAKLNSKSAELWNNLGGLEMARQNYSGALECFDKALAIDPELSYVLANAGQVQAKLGNAADAERAFRRALELFPKDADTANQLGLLLAQQDRGMEAARFLKAAIEIKPNHAAAINNLAVLYIRMRKVDDAIAAFQYGIKVAPDYDGLYMNLARVYTDIGQVENARQVLEQLLERKPSHHEARAALVQLGAGK